MGVFDLLSLAAGPDGSETWTPQAPPCLDGITDIELDCESDGLRWWDGDKPIGFSIALPDGTTQYLPFAHRGGGNLDEGTVKRWAQRELRGKRITNLNTRFDVHMMREWGVDLEEQGCEVSDVAHYAALLDDHRGSIGPEGMRGGFSLESLVQDYLSDEQKVKTVEGKVLDARRMSDYHAGVVAVRAEADVRQVQKLKRVLWPRLDAEDLQRVRKLEDDVIFLVCEMEKNGSPINVTLLRLWVKQAQAQMEALTREIWQETGLNINPKSSDDMVRLFEKLHLPIARTPPKVKSPNGNPSFAAPVLKKLAHHPTIKKVIQRNRLQDLLSKYLLPYSQLTGDIREAPDGTLIGTLRYALHQLRSQKDANDDTDLAGAISGRFSSTQLSDRSDPDKEGLNIQQIMKPSKQRVYWGYTEDDDSHDDEIYVIRKLHVPEPGYEWVSSDAMQIEYRLFADYTCSPRLLKIYEENPFASFHKKTHAMFLQRKPDLTYRRMKDVNFAQIYCAGPRKVAFMLEFITPEQWAMLKRDKAWRSNPLMKETLELLKIYDQEIPEAKELNDRAQHIAMPCCSERCNQNARSRRFHREGLPHRGFVMSILGRRSRYPDGDRIHKALNTVIQPSAADINKAKGVELYRERKALGIKIRFTVHDEWNLDSPSRESSLRVKEILNRQSFPQLKVPIFWDTSAGPNWKDGEAI